MKKRAIKNDGTGELSNSDGSAAGDVNPDQAGDVNQQKQQREQPSKKKKKKKK